MIFYLIRHGRQNSSDCNVNVPLADAGIKQAELLGKRLRNYSIDAVYCSDLIRAKQTVEIAFSHNEFLLDHLQVRSGLAEIDFGDLTGIPDAQVKSFYANYYKQQQHLFEQKRSNRQSKQPVTIDSPAKYVGDFFVPVEEMIYPGGEDGAMLLDRVLPVFDEILHTDAKQVAVVCHGGVIRVLLCALFGGSFARRLQFGTSLENCSITAIHYDETLHGFFLDRFNDSAHLEGHPELFRGH